MAQILAVTSYKGGVGKTTTAVSLAHGLARKMSAESRKGSVLLLDLDPQGHCSLALGLRPQGCVGDLLLGTARPEEVIIPADRSHDGGPARPNLYLLPATSRLLQVQSSLLARAAGDGMLRQLGRPAEDNPAPLSELLSVRLREVQQVFAFIVIDYPSPLDLLWQTVYHFSDGVVLPVKMDYLSVNGLRMSLSDGSTSDLDPKLQVLLPTFMYAGRVLAGQMLQELSRRFGARRVADPIPASVRLAEAPAAGGQTIFEYAPGSTPARAYQHLVERIYDGTN